jgi:hypothetical protein
MTFFVISSGKLYCTVNLPGTTANTSICVAGKDKCLLLAFTQTTCFIYDLLDNGKIIKPLLHPEKVKFGSISLAEGMC